MRIKCLSLLVLSFAILTSSFLAACTGTSESPALKASTPEDIASLTSDTTPITIGHIHTIQSDVFGTERNITVKLPARYAAEADRDFPVVYIIDGGAEQDFPHLAGMTQSFDLNWSVQPFILVGIETVNRRAEITPPSDDARYDESFPGRGGAGEFRRFIRTEVQPWVDGNYRTNSDRMVIGESLAGLFVVDSFLNDPTLFTKYAAVSPSLWWDKLSIVAPVKQRLASFPDGQREIYLTMANEGLQMQAGLDVLIDGLKSSAPEGVKWHYVDRRNQEHHGSIYQPAALDAFRTFFPMAGVEGASPKAFYLFADDNYPELTAEAKASLERDCTSDTAVRTDFKQTNKDWAKWNGMCVQRKLGPARTAGN